jgi:hypothetical protein
MGTEIKPPDWADDILRELRQREARETAERRREEAETEAAFQERAARQLLQRPLANEVWQASEPFRKWVDKARLREHARQYWKARVIQLRSFSSKGPSPALNGNVWLWWETHEPVHLYVEDGPRYHARSGKGLYEVSPSVLRAMLAYFQSEAPWEDVRTYLAGLRR